MLTRRAALLGAAAAFAPMPRLAWADSNAPTPAEIIAQARTLAGRPYSSARPALQPPFDALTYDSYRAVRPRPGRAADLALGDDFRADLLPPGWLFADPVHVSLPGHDTRFDPDLFSYDPEHVTLPDPLPDMGDMGFSGVRFRTQLNRPDVWDDVLVLQGASYFRALAKGTAYGLSSRALSLGTGGPAPEEFPVTRQITVFGTDGGLQFGCLIDSPRAAAALIADLTPGTVTRMRCRLHLFPREEIADVGIAPLTSMFQHNASGPARIDDFRPAVHDSDVLVIDNGAGERLWRPLANPAALQLSAFQDSGPRGFGLVQMPTDFASFLDQEGAYERRPTAWVRPHGDWGAGAVTVLEIPTEDEFADNIVAFWRPEAPLDVGGHEFGYDLEWHPPGPGALPARDDRLIPVRSASGIEPNLKEGRLFVLDFSAAYGTELPTDGIEADFGPTPGVEISGIALYPLHGRPGTLRVSFILTPEDDHDSAELRLALRDAAGIPVAPIWLYRWTRAAGGGV